MHRTTAAQNLKLDKVYIDLRTGTMDDFIETMHTDNFQFDPALDSSLGQLFTKTEKREACKQLLLLPKYLKLTNVALAEMWHTSEGNIRRWRGEMASLINDAPDRVGFCSGERLAEIQEILASPARENVAGDVVLIRSKGKPGGSTWDYYQTVQVKLMRSMVLTGIRVLCRIVNIIMTLRILGIYPALLRCSNSRNWMC